MLIAALYNMVDQIFIGHGVGYLGNGATNVVYPVTVLTLALSIMVCSIFKYLSGKGRCGECPQVDGKRCHSNDTCQPYFNRGFCCLE